MWTVATDNEQNQVGQKNVQLNSKLKQFTSTVLELTCCFASLSVSGCVSQTEAAGVVLRPAC